LKFYYATGLSSRRLFLKKTKHKNAVMCGNPENRIRRNADG
jgi:hypothetical protein